MELSADAGLTMFRGKPESAAPRPGGAKPHNRPRTAGCAAERASGRESRRRNRRQPAVVLAIAALIVLTFTACGQPVAGSAPRGRTDAASGAPDGPHPPVARSQGPSPDAALPRVSASGATVQALWQLRLIYSDIVGDTIVGLAGEGSAERLEALSALTGQPRWSVPAPAEPWVLGVLVEGPVVIVEAGGTLHDPARTIVVKEIAVYSLADGRSLWHTPVAVGPEYLPGSQRAYVAGTIVFAEPGESSSLAGQRREASSGARADHGRVRRVAVTKPAATRAWRRTAACWSPPTRANARGCSCGSAPICRNPPTRRPWSCGLARCRTGRHSCCCVASTCQKIRCSRCVSQKRQMSVLPTAVRPEVPWPDRGCDEQDLLDDHRLPPGVGCFGRVALL